MKKLILLYTLLLLIAWQPLLAKTIKVSNIIQLTAANKTALPGDSIVLQNGVWANCKIELNCNGTQQQPIVFIAQQAGKISITGKSYLRISGSYIVVAGLQFINGSSAEGDVWQFKLGKNVATNCRITNCEIYSFNNLKRLDENYWVAFYGRHNRIDHCSFTDKKNLGVLMAVVLDDERSRKNSHSIESNNFNYRIPLASNAGEIIRVGVSQHCTYYSNTVIRDNLFTSCDGEAEIISIKSCGNIIRNNIFKECQGSLSLRHGNNNTVEGNIFLGNGKEGTGGVRIINEGNWVINNLFYKCRGINFRSPLAIMNGVFNSPAYRYLPVRDAVIANNTFIDCTSFSLCEGSDSERSVSPKNVLFFNNVFLNKKDPILYETFDKVDSIYFFNNIADNSLKQALIKGFIKKKLSISAIQNESIIITNTYNNLQDSLQKMAVNRLAYGLPKTAGFNRWATYKKTLTEKYTTRGFVPVDFGKKTAHSPNDSTIKCANAAAIYKALETNKELMTISLTGTDYEFDKPIASRKSLIISGENNKQLRFTTTKNLIALFLVDGGATLTLSSLKIDGSGIKANNLIASDTSGSSNHFSLTLNKFFLTNLGIKNSCNNVFNAYKYSIADNIQITNSIFINNNCNLFSLKDETDNKGYYNVENIHIENCKFSNNTGRLLNLYRGGKDESTMGPKLFFINNKIFSCNNDGELIKLYGVQQSYFTNNLFSNSNIGKKTIVYLDNVRALHEQRQNLFSNSGTVSENKYVNTIIQKK